VTTDHVASYTCYRRGCRLEQCRTADRTQRKRYELQRLAGIPAVIPGPTIAAHLRTCIASGHTVRGIAARTGVSERAIGYILHGQATVTRKRAQSLLALKPLEHTLRVDPTGTIRRIQALACIGHPIAWTAEQAGYTPSYLFNIIAGRIPTVPRDVARRIALVYREHSARPGASRFARNSARRNGWHGPLVWDDIDDPNEQPDVEPNSEREPSRDELAAIRRAEIAHLLAFNRSYAEIASRLDMAPAYVRDIARSIRNDLEKAA
jgi:transcriptional regulator with XRE-family HTH domain